MVVKASSKGLVKGRLDQFMPPEILTMQYIDDTLMFYAYDNKALRNLKCVSMLFESVSRMRINFHKSEIIPIKLEGERIHEIAHILNCPVRAFPFKYLGTRW
jgi:hypothetical protein